MDGLSDFFASSSSFIVVFCHPLHSRCFLFTGYPRAIRGGLPGAGHARADAEDLPHEVVPLDGRGDAQGRCGGIHGSVDVIDQD